MQFANDPALELVVTTAAANAAKGDRGPADWLPPDQSAWCGYAAKYTRATAAYGLAVTAADVKVLHRILAGCRPIQARDPPERR